MNLTNVSYVRRLPSYSVGKIPYASHQDPFVSPIVQRLYPHLMEEINQYTRGLYDIEKHYFTFKKFEVALVDLLQYEQFQKSDPCFQTAINTAERQLFGDTRWDTLSLSSLEDVPYVGSSGSGYGYIGKKRANIQSAISNCYASSKIFIHQRHKYVPVPWMSYARTQLASRLKPKIREVWCPPFHHVLLEGVYAAPIIRWLKDSDTVMLYGDDLYIYNSESDFTRYKMLCLDWRSFDATASRYVIYECFNRLVNRFNYKGPMEAACIENVIEQFVQTPILMPDGRLYNVNGGIPSGSYFTQVIGSFINLIYIHYIGMKFFPHGLHNIKVLGDDSTFLVDRSDLYDLGSLVLIATIQRE